jgi:hypothetical protein
MSIRLSLLLLAGMLLLSTAAATAATRRLPSNTVVLTTRGNALAASRERRRTDAVALDVAYRRLITQRVWTPRTRLLGEDTFVLSSTAPTATRARGGPGDFTFTFQGWSAEEEAALRAFLLVDERAYPKLVALCGAPMLTATLALVRDDTLPSLLSGEVAYDAGTNTITARIRPGPEDVLPTVNAYFGLALCRLLLHAGHLPMPLGYDAWEDGLAGAGALVTMMQVRPDTMDFDPGYVSEYLLPLYSNLNLPELSTPAFHPLDGIPLMAVWRTGMALSAWLKVYTEYPTVFADFQKAYTAAVTATPGVASDLNALKGIMATMAPTVEGVNFLDWYPAQYALVPDFTPGARFYTYAVPEQDALSLLVHYFNAVAATDGSGNPTVRETPLAGTATLTYHTWYGRDISDMPYEGNTIAIDASGYLPGVGTLLPTFYNINGPQRVQVTINLAGYQRLINYAYGVRGDYPNENTVFGVVDGVDSGMVNVTFGAGTPTSVPIMQGVFSLLRPGGLTFFAPATYDITASTAKVTLHSNVGPGYASAVLKVTDPHIILQHHFTAGLALVSFPLTPSVGDARDLFYPTNPPLTFPFAWWDPSLAEADKYRRWPALDAVTTGRGYWVNLSEDLNLSVSGLQPDDAARAITLQPGWNAIGNTDNAARNTWGLTVQTPTQNLRLIDAMVGNWVGPVWNYDTTTGVYQVKGTLEAWEGGWLYNRTGGALTLLQSGATRTATVPPLLGPERATLDILTANGWGVALHARQDTAQDVVYLGAAPSATRNLDAVDWQKPPIPTTTAVHLGLQHPARPADGYTYAADIRAPLGLTAETWDLAVTAPAAGPVTLTWPTLVKGNHALRLTLTDTVSGAGQDLLTAAAYTYTSEVAETRRFRVTAESTTDAALAITSLQVVPIPGQGATVTFALAAPADVTLEVRAVTGRKVAYLTSTACPANSATTFAWDGRGFDGAPVAPGTYLLFLTARAAGLTAQRGAAVKIQ